MRREIGHILAHHSISIQRSSATNLIVSSRSSFHTAFHRSETTRHNWSTRSNPRLNYINSHQMNSFKNWALKIFLRKARAFFKESQAPQTWVISANSAKTPIIYSTHNSPLRDLRTSKKLASWPLKNSLRCTTRTVYSQNQSLARPSGSQEWQSYSKIKEDPSWTLRSGTILLVWSQRVFTTTIWKIVQGVTQLCLLLASSQRGSSRQPRCSIRENSQWIMMMWEWWTWQADFKEKFSRTS